jgi:hypothetical protein
MLDTIDRTEPAEAPAKTVRLEDKITLLKDQFANAGIVFPRCWRDGFNCPSGSPFRSDALSE